jgi:flagellar biosynthesis/type III secretory pathway chaperone
MAEAGETLLQILQSITAAHTQLVDTLSRMEQRQQEHNAALVQMLDRIDARSAAIDARIAADSRALAEILERIVQTTTRTEQMTARILAEVAKGAPQ